LALTDASLVGEARRAVTALARRLGFDETGCSKVALLVSEAAGNVLKHASAGELLARVVERNHSVGLELHFLDRGPGMADPARCFSDGFSTAGTPGTGLGAIARQSSFFDLYSLPAEGTAVVVRVWSQPEGPKSGTRSIEAESSGFLEVAAVHVPKAGQEVCGDGWATEQEPGRSILLVTDGLGHGPLAAEAAREAVRVFREQAALGPGGILERIHLALRSTRGAAVGIAEVNFANRTLRFSGVGNIAGTIVAGGTSRSTISHNGTVGHELRKIQDFDYAFPKGALLVIHSDGLASHWRLDRYAGLAARDPGLIAGILYRDFKRGRDDVTILAAREANQSPA
jgi:anti-sigma regulatory factor (Ser/Thr protein kinase)